MSIWRIALLSVLSCILAGIVAYSLSYWAARGWYDGKNKRHG